jgi:putative hydrolase of the HAD superfamily
MPPSLPARRTLPYAAVVFDFFNTLTAAVHRGPHHAYIAAALGCELAAWLATLDRTFQARSAGAYGRTVDGLRRLAAEADGRPGKRQLRVAFDARVRALCADAPLRPAAVPVLRALRRRGVRVAVASDCWYELPKLLPRLPVAQYIDASVFSVEVGQTKPHAAMYLTVCDRLGVEPRQCLYVGDGGNRELSGAAATGMTAVRLAAPDLGRHLTFNAETDWSGPSIGSLAEVVTAVRAEPAG